MLQVALHPLGVVLAFFDFRLNWIELRGVPVETVRGKWNSFTHLKIKHLTGSSACVSSSRGLTITQKIHSHTFQSFFIQHTSAHGICVTCMLNFCSIKEMCFCDLTVRTSIHCLYPETH